MSAAPLSSRDKTIYERGFREGVHLMLDLAARTARVIAADQKRALQKGFAAAALDELAKAGADLLLGRDDADPVPAAPTGPPSQPAGEMAAVL